MVRLSCNSLDAHNSNLRDYISDTIVSLSSRKSFSEAIADDCFEYEGYNDNGTGSVVIGYDARHFSEKFARLTAAVFLSMGFHVLWFGRHVHTPMVRHS